MNGHLSTEVEECVEEKVASGLSRSASEVVREALRVLAGRDDVTVPETIERVRGVWARELSDSLEAGDACCYVGSHCVRTASDVKWFFFRLLPQLRPGVVVHLHDDFSPESYPVDWMFERDQSWSEQDLLQTCLMHDRATEIMIANRWRSRREPELLDRLYRGVQPAWGRSFWFRKVEPH